VTVTLLSPSPASVVTSAVSAATTVAVAAGVVVTVLGSVATVVVVVVLLMDWGGAEGLAATTGVTVGGAMGVTAAHLQAECGGRGLGFGSCIV
jgi:ABC-type multidrug transport system permease subunit